MKNPPKRRSVVGVLLLSFFREKSGNGLLEGQWTESPGPMDSSSPQTCFCCWLVGARERERERAEQRGVTLRWLLPPKKRSCLNSYLACCAPFLLILMNHWSTFLADADGSSFPPPSSSSLSSILSFFPSYLALWTVCLFWQRWLLWYVCRSVCVVCTYLVFFAFIGLISANSDLLQHWLRS